MQIQKETSARKSSWRDVLPVHPAAELFPPMPPDELKALGQDIKETYQLAQPIALLVEGKTCQLVDGRNRLDAMEQVGIEFEIRRDCRGRWGLDVDGIESPDPVILLHRDEVLPYVVSANLHRRHLTTEKKREIVAALLKAKPERSNNATAKIAKVDDKTVGAVRAEMERRSEIPNVSTRTDSKGREQPASKPRKLTTKPPPVTKPSADAQAIREAAAARKDAEIEELRNAKRQLEIKIAGLESEVVELREVWEKRLEQLIIERRKYADAPLPPINCTVLPLGDQLIILIGLLENGLAPMRKLLALELPTNASVRTRAQLDGIEGMVGAVFNWMSTTQEYVAEIKQALDDYALATASTPAPPIDVPSADGRDIPEFLPRSGPSQ
jgi:hypothetical protein